MIVYLTTIPGPGPGRQTVRIHADGQLIAQAIDREPAAAERRAIRQAYRWGGERGWGRLTFRKPAREVHP